MLARPIPRPAALVLEHAAPAAYCVPTRGGRVVITSSALSRLTPSEGAAVVEHERAHLLRCPAGGTSSWGKTVPVVIRLSVCYSGHGGPQHNV
ncbi:M48 family metalloprotease [Streptomyces canus]|uniref:M48 family metalloprotease n=1 Tax=Streptomyces canus TaxID=58343 RepID=UPI003AF3D81C